MWAARDTWRERRRAVGATGLHSATFRLISDPHRDALELVALSEVRNLLPRRRHDPLEDVDGHCRDVCVGGHDGAIAHLRGVAEITPRPCSKCGRDHVRNAAEITFEMRPRSRSKCGRDHVRNAAEITFETRPRSRLQPLDGAVVVCEELLERRVEPHLPATRLPRQAQRPCEPMPCGGGLGTRADGLTECAP